MTREISAMEVSPRRTLAKPSSCSRAMPSCSATRDVRGTLLHGLGDDGLHELDADSIRSREANPKSAITSQLGPRFRSPNARILLHPMDDPMPLTRDVAVPLREVIVRTSRSSGPGGQHANVTASRVEAVFDVAASAALSDAQKQRVMALWGPRVVAVAQDARSQARNRELALERLRGRLAGALAVARPRRPTRPSAGARARQAAAKRQRAARKRERGRRFSAED